MYTHITLHITKGLEKCLLMLDRFEFVSFEVGAVVMRRGAAIDSYYFITSGSAQEFKAGSRVGYKRVVGTYFKGNSFDEVLRSSGWREERERERVVISI